MARRPAGFILWTDDALSSSRIAMMTDEEFRAYWNLLFHCWNLSCSLPGPLPDSLYDWERLAGRPVSKNVQKCFIPHPDKPGYYTHPKLYLQFKRREQARLAGKAGAEARWSSETDGETISETDSEQHGETDASYKLPSYQASPRKREMGTRSLFDSDSHVERFNSRIAPLLRCSLIRGITKKRLAGLRLRLDENPNLWDEIEEEAGRTSGKYLGDPAFKDAIRFIDFDWLILHPDNLNKFLEGKYRKQDQINVRREPTQEELDAAFQPPTGIKTHRDYPVPPAARGSDMDCTERKDCKNHKDRTSDGSGLSPLFEFNRELPGDDAGAARRGGA